MSAAKAPDQSTTASQKPTPAPAPQATTAPKKSAKKKQPKSTTDQILDDAGAVANSIGSSIRNSVDSVWDDPSSSSSHKTKKNKPNK